MTESSDHSTIPHWLKTSGAFVGILVALSGAIAGLYQVHTSLQQFQLQMKTQDVQKAKEEKETAQAKFKQAAEENKKVEIEIRGQVALQQKQLEIKKAEEGIESEKRRTTELTNQRERQSQEQAERFKVAGERRIDQRESEKQLTDYVSSLFGGGNSPSKLANLSRYATPADPNLSTILTPLVAKLDEIESPTEISIIFQLFSKSGPPALNAVLDSNRNAFEKYKRDITDLTLIELSGKVPHQGEPRLTGEQVSELKYKAIARLNSASLTSHKTFPLIERIVTQVIDNLLDSNEPVVKTDSWGAILNHARIQVEILNQSKRCFLRLLDSTTSSIDLSGTDLSDVKFPAFAYRAVNFRNAYLVGSDLSALALDRDSLLSIFDADVGTRDSFDYTSSAAPEWALRRITSAVRLSKDQLSVLSTSKRG